MRDSGLNFRATAIRTRLGPRPRARSGGRSPKGGSGLRRAAELRSRFGISSQPQADSGINAEDRREIEQELELVTRRSRTASGPEAFVIKPTHKGYIFPLLVNLTAAVLTAGSVYGLARLFGQRDQAMATSAAAVGSAEGLLLQQLKQEADSELKKKDQDIADIRTKMSALDKERSDLAGSLDVRVKAKEAELQSSYQSQLDAEKKRLGTQGLSDADIQARMKAFEATKSAESAKLLDEEKAKAASDLAQADDNYRKLKDEYQKSMMSIGQDRAALEADSKKREDELRSTMEAKNKELESRNAETEANLAAAKAQLASLADSKAKTQAVEDRVLGFYGSIQTALRDGRYADASSNAASLSAFVQDPSVASDASTKSRRSADAFVAQTLEAYARSELERTSVDATMLLRQSQLLSAARDSASAADKALKAGDADLAAAKYQEALQKVPELYAAHDYFMQKAREAQAAKDSRLADSLAAAEKSFRSKDLAAASAMYAEALGYLPVSAADRDAIVSRLEELGVSASESSQSASNTAAARPILAAAYREAAAFKWAEAIGDYVSLIASCPRAEQVQAALSGIQAAAAGLRKSLEDSMASAAASSSEALAELKAQLASSSQRESDLSARVAGLEKLLREEKDSAEAAAAKTGPALDPAVVAAKDGRIAELEAEVARLQDLAGKAAAQDSSDQADAGKYRALVESYKAYLSREEQMGSVQGRISAGSGLYSLLGESAFSQAFPGLRDRVGGYVSASSAEILQSFPSDAAEISRQASLYKDRGTRLAFLSSRRDTYMAAGNTLMTDFIDALTKALD